MIEIDYLFTSILGYTKYSLENVEEENLDMLKQKNKIEIYWRTRKFGTLFFNVSRNFKDKWFLFVFIKFYNWYFFNLCCSITKKY